MHARGSLPHKYMLTNLILQMASSSRDGGGPVTIEPHNFIFYDAGESVAYECEHFGLVKYGVIQQTQILIIQGWQSNDTDSNPDIPVQLFELVAEGVLKLRPGPPIAVKKSNILWNITV